MEARPRPFLRALHVPRAGPVAGARIRSRAHSCGNPFPRPARIGILRRHVRDRNLARAARTRAGPDSGGCNRDVGSSPPRRARSGDTIHISNSLGGSLSPLSPCPSVPSSLPPRRFVHPSAFILHPFPAPRVPRPPPPSVPSIFALRVSIFRLIAPNARPDRSPRSLLWYRDGHRDHPESSFCFLVLSSRTPDMNAPSAIGPDSRTKRPPSPRSEKKDAQRTQFSAPALSKTGFASNKRTQTNSTRRTLGPAKSGASELQNPPQQPTSVSPTPSPRPSGNRLAQPTKSICPTCGTRPMSCPRRRSS